MLNLIKKDFLIAKKVWIFVLLGVIVVPLFLTFVGSDVRIPSGLALSITSILLAMILFSSLDEEEEKYPKASALMSTIGYSRTVQILKRYVLMLLFYLYSALIYFIESGFMQGLGELTLSQLIFSLFSFVLISSIYLALTTALGVRAGRYVVMFVVLLISLGPVIISKLNIQLRLSDLRVLLNESSLLFALAVLSFILYLLSLKISLRAYKKKEL
ncbi:MAG: ABC-2 transporter permease [Bacillota bacterium]|nr:ABC-2 transporter permease [Bacillota bacterium]